MELFDPYKITILVSGLTGLLLLIQIIVADIAAIKGQHTPGYPIKPDHKSFLFRAARAHANTNESIVILALFILFGVLSSANAFYLNTFSVVYFVGRVAHMGFYYGNLKLARSISFPLSLIGLVGMFITGLVAWV
jgi:uncharacterized MAPEG superfamily protein